MNWLDIAILVGLVIPALIGLKTGMIKIVFSLIGVVVGIFLAGRFHTALAGRLTFIPQGSLAEIAAFAIILVACLLVAALLARVLHSITSLVLLGWVDHLGGALFGLISGLLSWGFVLAIWARFFGASGPIADSAMAKLLLEGFPIVLALLPEDFSRLLQR